MIPEYQGYSLNDVDVLPFKNSNPICMDVYDRDKIYARMNSMSKLSDSDEYFWNYSDTQSGIMIGMNTIGIISLLFITVMIKKYIKEGNTRVKILIPIILLALVANTAFHIFIIIDTDKRMSNTLFIPIYPLWVLLYKMTPMLQ